MAISEELKRIYASAPIDDYYVETLSLDHPAFGEFGTRYVTSENGGFIAKLETGQNVAFDYLPFIAVPPAATEEASITLQVAIDNASLTLMQELENMSLFPSEPIVVVYRVYLKSDPATLQNDPPLTLSVASVRAAHDVVSFSATLTNLRDRPFPGDLYDVERFPGLER